MIKNKNLPKAFAGTAVYAKERGTPVPASRYTVALPDGSSTITFGLDISKALCPDRSYSADIANVVYENGAAKLLFGQLTRDGNVRSMIEISMNPTNVMDMVVALGGLQSPTLESIKELMGLEVPDLYDFTKDPKDVGRLKANLMALSYAGSEATMDFFEYSTFAVSKLQTSNDLNVNVQGVVRIDTQTGLVIALKNGLSKIAEKFPDRIRKGLMGEYERI